MDVRGGGVGGFWGELRGGVLSRSQSPPPLPTPEVLCPPRWLTERL